MTEPYPPETNTAGGITSFIALPTTFTPPSSCSTIYRLNGFSLVAYDPGFGIDIDTRVKCAPPAVTTWWEQGRLGVNDGDGHTALSIGPLTCPDRWSTVATSVKDEISTLAMCCPPDYTLAHGITSSIAGDCLSNVLTGAVMTFASQNETNSRWQMNTTTLEFPIYVGAIAVVGWTFASAPSVTQSRVSSEEKITATQTPTRQATTDISAFPRQTAPSQPLSTTSPFKPTETPSATSSGIPLSTTIGVGVGVGLGVIAMFLVAFLLWRRRRKQRRPPEASGPVFEVSTPIHYQPDKYVYPSYYHELYGSRGRRSVAVEMPVPQYFSELDAGIRR